MKTRAVHPSFLVLAICYALMTFGCADASVNNANARNASVNANSNTAANSTSDSNAASNTLNTTGVNSESPVQITPDTLKAALKKRLMHDGLSILNEKDWGRDEWMVLNVGDFYHSNDATSKQKISDTTAEVLRTVNKMMTTSARQRLEDNVTSMTKCKTALELMQTAARDTNTTGVIP